MLIKTKWPDVMILIKVFSPIFLVFFVQKILLVCAKIAPKHWLVRKSLFRIILTPCYACFKSSLLKSKILIDMYVYLYEVARKCTY
jgi:hypothetical protein